jgi:Glycosyl hydrolases family 43
MATVGRCSAPKSVHINVPVAMSDDLREWAAPVDALPQLPTWADKGRTWAPGVLRRDNGFVLYFAARSRALGLQCIGAATAEALKGPYSSPEPEPLLCQPQLGGSIDPPPVIDSDGTACMLSKADANAIRQTSQIFARTLRPNGLALAGEPGHCSPPRRPVGTTAHREPALLAVDGAYVLLYSGGWRESAGYAACDTPLARASRRSPHSRFWPAREIRPEPAVPQSLPARPV